jgi:hypothetical protein
MKLLEQIVLMQKEVGYKVQLCNTTKCEYKVYNPRIHCREEIPYTISDKTHRVHLEILCHKKIDDYFTKSEYPIGVKDD